MGTQERSSLVDDTPHLRATPLLDLGHPTIRDLVDERGWRDLPEHERIGAVYAFVRDEIPFGYNTSDDRPASEVLADGFGQCNTKTVLLMALLRSVGIRCRLHGATIHKRLQRGVVTGLAYRLAPTEIAHTWAEVHLADRWVGLEGVILDAAYLDGIRALHPDQGAFLGFGVGVDDLADPPIRWCGSDTTVQSTGIVRDHGTFDDPDAFYERHGANLTGLRGVWYRSVVRRKMNRTVARIRAVA